MGRKERETSERKKRKRRGSLREGEKVRGKRRKGVGLCVCVGGWEGVEGRWERNRKRGEGSHSVSAFTSSYA